MKLSPALKLTAWYLAFVMLLSIMFSIFVYRVSIVEIERGLRRPGIGGPRILFEDQEAYDLYRLQRLKEGGINLRGNLLTFNMIVFVLGGGLSYFLARRTIRPIEEALEAQTRFTADASHELRTPLTVMQTEIEVALRDPKLSARDARELLSSNLEEVSRVRSLVEGLLRLARNGGAVEHAEKLSLNQTAEAALERVAKLARAKRITIHSQLKPASVRGDAEHLTELAVILLDNAIKYSPRGGSVWVTTSKQGRLALLAVRDEGPGIATSELPHIFERFYRADASRSKHKVEGFGIGLSIAEQIAVAHGGRIDVQSKPKKGSTFTLKLPQA